MKTQQSKSEFGFHGINYMFYLRVISFVHVHIQFVIKHFLYLRFYPFISRCPLKVTHT